MNSKSENKIRVLMCGSDLSNGGGVVSVTKNYLESSDWNNTIIDYIATHINGSAIKKIVFFIKSFLKIRREFQENNYDIVHLHVCNGGPFFRKAIIVYIAKRYKVKIVLHHHTDYRNYFNSIKGLHKKIVVYAIKNADINIVLGQYLKQQIESFIPNCNTIIIKNGIKTLKSNPYNENSVNISFIGWFKKRKGFFDLLKAFSILDNVLDRKYKLILCGDGSNEELKIIKEYHLENRISYIGWANDDIKEKLYKNILVNVLPSYREGMPMTILETMSYGIPNIGSDIPTIKEIISNNINGYIVDVGNSNSIASAILNYINYSNKEIISNNAFNDIENIFNVKTQINLTEEMYMSILNGYK